MSLEREKNMEKTLVIKLYYSNNKPMDLFGFLARIGKNYACLLIIS